MRFFRSLAESFFIIPRFTPLVKSFLHFWLYAQQNTNIIFKKYHYCTIIFPIKLFIDFSSLFFFIIVYPSDAEYTHQQFIKIKQKHFGQTILYRFRIHDFTSIFSL